MPTSRSTLIGRAGAARVLVPVVGAVTALGAAVAIGLGSGAATAPAQTTTIDDHVQTGEVDGRQENPWSSEGRSSSRSAGQQDFGHARSHGS